MELNIEGEGVVERVKLSGPQRALLADIAEHPRYVVDSYPPAKSLVEKGLARWDKVRFGASLHPTEAGLAALSPSGGRE